MDDGLLNKPQTDNQDDSNTPVDDSINDDVQEEIDEALDKLPDDLEKKMPPAPPPTPPSVPPASVPPAPPTSPIPPTPPIPPVEPVDTPKPELPDLPLPPADEPEMEVKPEKPETIKPPNKMVKGLKKNGKKIAGGMLVVALLLGGVLVGTNMVKQRQVVESEAKKSDEKAEKSKDKAGKVDKVQGTHYTVFNADGSKRVKKINDGTYQGLRLKANQANKSIEEYVIDEYGDDLTEYDFEEGEIKKDAQFTAGKQKLLNLLEKGNITNFRYKGIIYTDPEEIKKILINSVAEDWVVYVCTEKVKDNQAGCSASATGMTLYEFFESGQCGFVQMDSPGSSGDNAVGFDLTECGGGGGDGGDGGNGDSYACTSLDASPSAQINVGDSVKVECSANFSGYTPIAYFRYSKDGGVTWIEEGVEHDLTTTNPAETSFTIDDYGDWRIQCQVCTDNTMASCTAWGQAN